MNKNLKMIDPVTMTVTVSHEFLMKSGQFGTPEFYEALEMKKDGYRLVRRKIKRNPEKRTYANLTYEKMESFIGAYWTDGNIRKNKLEEFDYIKKWAKTQTAAYAKVKEWFMAEYGASFDDEEARRNAAV